MAVVLQQGKQSYINDAGQPLVGGRLYTYAAGTTTPKTTWSDAGQTAPNTNPIILNARGEATVFWNGAYKVELRTAADVPIWTVDNLNALNDPLSASSFAGPTGSSLMGFIQSGTGAVTRTAQDKMRESYSAKDFGAVGDGVTDDTAALQLAITAALANGRSLFLPAGNYATTGLTVAMTGGPTSASSTSFTMFGEGKMLTRLTKIGASTAPIINLTTATEPQTLNVILSRFALFGNATTDGIRNTGCASVTYEQIWINSCDSGLNWIGVINSQAVRCFIVGCVTGIKARANGALTAYSNANSIRDCVINDNTAFGIDIGQASNIRILDCTLERGGTPGNTATGAIIFRSTVDDEIGYGHASIHGCWLEQNYGRAVQVETVGTDRFLLSITNTNIISSEGGRAFFSAGGGIFKFDNCIIPSGGDTINATCYRLTLINTNFSTLSGTQTYLLVENTEIGSAPIEGTHQRDVWIGGGNGLVVSSGAGANRYKLAANGGTGDLELTAPAGGTGQMKSALSINLNSPRIYAINNIQVVGPQGAAVANATDAASAITQLNALLARCRAHGLIAP